MTFDTIVAFVLWLGTSGGVTVIVGLLAERLAAFQELSPKARQGIIWTVALLLPQLSLLLLEYVPEAAWLKLDPFFQALVVAIGALVTLAISEGAHEIDKRLQGDE